MFTGIIQAIGRIVHCEPRGGDLSLVVEGLPPGRAAVGDSIAVNGVCLTATAITATRCTMDVSRETLALTTLGALAPGARVNLETAVTLATPLGGHLVSGHVDGIGQVTAVREEARSRRLRIAAPAELTRYIARKGAIAVDGISLTVNEIDGLEFTLNLVPHTLTHTIAAAYRPGTRVNLEVDLIARYLERLLHGAVDCPATGISAALLAQHGFLDNTRERRGDTSGS